MMKETGKGISTLGGIIFLTLLVLGITIILQKFAVPLSPAGQEAVKVDPYPSIDSRSSNTESYPFPEPTPTIQPTSFSKYPICNPGVLDKSTLTITDPQVYEFKEPEVIIKADAALDIANFLPDSEQLLFTQRIPEKPQSYVSVLNTNTNEINNLGISASLDGGLLGSNLPVWLSKEQVAAFVNFNSKNQLILQIGSDKENVQDAVIGLASPILTASPAGQNITFFPEADPGRPNILNLLQGQPQVTSTDIQLPADFDPRLEALSNYQISWHPNGELVALYNDKAFYLSNLVDGKTCELDLGNVGNVKKWVGTAKWSPNGKYLAAITTVGKPVVPFLELTIVDLTTSEYHQVQTKEGSNVYSFTWSPDSDHVLFAANNPTNQNGDELYIYNLSTNETERILENYSLAGVGYLGLSWSPNGKMIALTCPFLPSGESVIKEFRLCLIKVNIT